MLVVWALMYEKSLKLINNVWWRVRVFKVERGETMNQIRDYTALVKRRSELLLLSGSSWKEGYADELRQIDEQISEMRKEMKLDE